MVPQVVVPSALETLPARPPTPPRERTHAADLKQKLARQTLNSRRSLHTPPSYSPESSDLSTSRRTRKKVGFSSQTEYCEAPVYADNAKNQPTPVSASSAASLTKPIKSILKPSPPVIINPLDPTTGIDDENRHVNIAIMLESTIKQLAGADRDSKVDAYMILVRALKVSNNLPDRVALQDKMSLFMQFIQRDITTKNPTGNLDSTLTNQALSLLCTFNQFPAIASTLSNDFGVFIVDHCIKSFEDASVPKEVARHFMHVMATQNFTPKVITADRVGRLVSSLHNIEEHLKGKSIIQGRLMIYRRLIQNSKSHMVVHSDWLLDLFTDMLSDMKEIRGTAIALGLESSFTIGKEKLLSRKVMEILQLSVDDDQYVEYYTDRLKDMAKEKQVSVYVPQIWSVVVLLLGSPVRIFKFLDPMLKILQLCFNSSDFPTKFEANYAWNRLVYVLHGNEQSFSNPKNMAMISEPFVSQLRRKGSGKQSEELRKVVVGSICNLLYYAFKPNTSSSHVDSYWDSYVCPLLRPMIVAEVDAKSSESSLAAVQDLTTQAIKILTGLFNSSTPRLWKEDRVSNNCGLVKPEELPALDPKWARRNASRAFAMIEPVLSKTFCDLADKNSPSSKLWSTLLGAVASAASKEIKVSTDTAVFLAHAFTFFLQVWSRGIQPSPDGSDRSLVFFDAARMFLSTVIDSLGPLPFTEKQLSMGNQNIFMPVATPSHRPTKGHGLIRTPLHHLFSILASLPPGTNDDESLAHLTRTIFKPFFIVKASRRVDLAHELMQLLPMDSLSPYGLWLVISEALHDSLENSQASHSSNVPGSQPPVGHEYREIVKHLERGIRSTPNLPWEHWNSLFHMLVMRANKETGEAGCAIAIIEPLAKAMLDTLSNEPKANISLILFRCGIELITNAKQPRDRGALDAARRRLWGTATVSGSKSASFDPYESLYKLINHLLDVSYRQFDENDTQGVVVPLLTEVTGFVTRCNPLLVFKSLVLMQDGLGIWIQDADEHYNSRQFSDISEAAKLLWNRICSVFIDADNLDQVQLDMIEPLLCSAFESKHRHIVNTVSAMWNQCFEHADEVPQYPERLKAVLTSLRHYVDIVFPGLDLSSYESSGQQPPFIDSQNETDALNPLNKTSKERTPKDKSSLRPSSRRSATPGSNKVSLPSKRQLETTPTVSRSKSATSARRSSTPRVRHDDSQIQFAAIESSSPTHVVEESQILTDRQKEVHERQQENAALFSEIRPDAERTKISTPPKTSDEKTSTPKTHRSFEDYVSSTPTPRRGQALAIDDNDHEMTDDVPSSPPEPRRYPLVPEILKSLSSSSSLLDDWSFMSSPISGSPLQNRHVNAAEAKSANVRAPRQPATEASDIPNMAETEAIVATLSGDSSEHEDVDEEPEDYMTGHEEPVEQTEDSLPAILHEPATPRAMRSLKAQETPRSDNDVFVDALSSPTPQTPRVLRSIAQRAQEVGLVASNSSHSKDRSFEASEVDWRLVVEIDSRRCEPMPTYVDESSPEKPRVPSGSSPVLDCITVSTGSEKRRKSKRRKGEQSSTVIPSTPAETQESETSSKKSKKKRKRISERSLESSQKKRRHNEGVDENAGAVPNSQLLPDADHVSSTPSKISGKEAPPSYSQESLGQQAVDENNEAPKSPSSIGDGVDESEAVNLQLVQEASHNEETRSPDENLSAKTVVEVIAGAEDMDVDVEEGGEEDMAPESGARQAEPEPVVTEAKPAVQKIMECLSGGLDELRTANLTRDEVYRIESMFMDIKRELYEAESRGRK